MKKPKRTIFAFAALLFVGVPWASAGENPVTILMGDPSTRLEGGVFVAKRIEANGTTQCALILTQRPCIALADTAGGFAESTMNIRLDMSPVPGELKSYPRLFHDLTDPNSFFPPPTPSLKDFLGPYVQVTGPLAHLDKAQFVQGAIVSMDVREFKIIEKPTPVFPTPQPTEDTAHQQTLENLNQIRAACSNYFRKNNNKRPNYLGYLVPEFLPAVPPDVVTGSNMESRTFTGNGGWIYDPSMGIIKPNLAGKDPTGRDYKYY